MSTRTIRTAAALRPAGQWEQAIPLPAFGPAEAAAPLRRPRSRQPQRPVYRAPAPRRRRRRRLAGAVVRLTVVALCVWALLRVLGEAQSVLADGIDRAKALFSVTVGMNAEAPEAFGVPEVEPVLQNPTLPNGCEAASLATLLRYAGVEADAAQLAMEWIPRQEFYYSGPDRFGPDPEQAYAGDPTSPSGGWYCFAAPVAQGANNYLTFIGSSLRAEDLTGASFSKLEQQLADGRPVAVWFTQDYADPRFSEGFTWTLPTGEEYTPYANLHCLVLTGMEGGDCLLADPLSGSTRVDRDTFERIYTAMGSRALVVR